jgi:hypothetical protein
MKNISNLQLEFLRRQAFVLACVLIWPATSFAQEYQQTILVANAAGQGAATVDPSLVDPWGIARGTTSPWWVSDRATGVSTVYNADYYRLPFPMVVRLVWYSTAVRLIFS